MAATAVEVFDDLLRADLVERGRIEHVLRSALAGTGGAELSVAHQPVHDLDTGAWWASRDSR